MPKRARSRVGHQRPKKKKVEEGVAAEEESDDLEEGEDDEEETPPAPEPGAAPASSPAPDPAPVLMTRLQELEQEHNAACAKAVTVIKRWLKTVDTYFNKSNGGFLWEETSVVKRNLDRLRAIDAERDEAENFADYKKNEVMSYKNWEILRRAAAKFPRRASYARQRDLARERLQKLRLSWFTGEYQAADRRPKRGATVEEQVGMIMLQVGLAEAIQWVHARDLREELNPDYESPEAIASREEAKAQAAARHRETVRARIERVLQAERDGSRPRADRSFMMDLNFCSDRGLVPELLREMGECLCVRAGIERVSDRCEMCRAEAV